MPHAASADSGSRQPVTTSSAQVAQRRVASNCSTSIRIAKPDNPKRHGYSPASAS